MTTEYTNYLKAQIAKCDAEWKQAMADGRFDDAYVAGYNLSKLEAILLYHIHH